MSYHGFGVVHAVAPDAPGVSLAPGAFEMLASQIRVVAPDAPDTGSGGTGGSAFQFYTAASNQGAATGYTGGTTIPYSPPQSGSALPYSPTPTPQSINACPAGSHSVDPGPQGQTGFCCPTNTVPDWVNSKCVPISAVGAPGSSNMILYAGLGLLAILLLK